MEIPRERELKEKKTLTQVTQVKENKRASAKLPYYSISRLDLIISCIISH